ncbi:hypothetical protein GCM10025857_11260 [Alicyclobacillus contaminans]|nr:hypothetical protein GCM10025857_11260 [Alicyclobacillus contaminans]
MYYLEKALGNMGITTAWDGINWAITQEGGTEATKLDFYAPPEMIYGDLSVGLLPGNSATLGY